MVRLSFQDGTNETVGSVIGDLSGNLTILSIHGNPRAGILITGLYRTFLLVEASTSTTCLLEVPKTAVFGRYYNSTSQGTTVKYPNGTEDFFPVNSCPVPVTPENYLVDSIIQANPKFIAAENGSIYEATNACNCSLGAGSSNSTGKYVILNFVLYSSQKIFPCGPNSYWTYKQLGLIQVTIAINSTGELRYSNAEIQSEPGFNEYTCTTTAQST